MAISIRLPSVDEALLEHAASALRMSKSEFIRRSIAAYAEKTLPSEQTRAEIDARYIGQGGGLRKLEKITDPRKRAIVERLHEKYGYAG
jgi:Arc/MetJ-type ribon-helix-helix transcriptional regulator